MSKTSWFFYQIYNYYFSIVSKFKSDFELGILKVMFFPKNIKHKFYFKKYTEENETISFNPTTQN